MSEIICSIHEDVDFYDLYIRDFCYETVSGSKMFNAHQAFCIGEYRNITLIDYDVSQEKRRYLVFKKAAKSNCNRDWCEVAGWLCSKCEYAQDTQA